MVVLVLKYLCCMGLTRGKKRNDYIYFIYYYYYYYIILLYILLFNFARQVRAVTLRIYRTTSYLRTHCTVYYPLLLLIINY